MPHSRLTFALMTAVVVMTFGQGVNAEETAELAPPAPLFPDTTPKPLQVAPQAAPAAAPTDASGWKPVPQVQQVTRAEQQVVQAQDEIAEEPLAIAPGGPRKIGAGYPYLNAPMSPTPRPDIPYQAGGSYITNQALFPHEMLYPHEYEAMYPPFYYRAKGRIAMTRDGIRVKEKWELQGTRVKVKYRSFIGLGTLFKTPFHRTGTRWR